MGHYYRFGWGGIPKDITLAIEYWRKAAELGNTDAIFNLGVSYLNGDGVMTNESLGYSYMVKGMLQGDAKCIRGVALCYREGKYVQHNMNEAIRLYKQASELGDIESTACLGSIYALGEGGIPKDIQEAVKWFYAAAMKGHTDAQRILGVMYIKGMGVPKNESEGISWIKKAAQDGDESSISFLKTNGLL